MGTKTSVRSVTPILSAAVVTHSAFATRRMSDPYARIRSNERKAHAQDEIRWEHICSHGPTLWRNHRMEQAHALRLLLQR